jgi:hypothetical protein
MRALTSHLLSCSEYVRLESFLRQCWKRNLCAGARCKAGSRLLRNIPEVSGVGCSKQSYDRHRGPKMTLSRMERVTRSRGANKATWTARFFPVAVRKHRAPCLTCRYRRRSGMKKCDERRRKGAKICTSERPRRVGKKNASWDLSTTWRYRRKEVQRFLSSLERRYLKDALASLEQSGQDLTGTFPVRTLRPKPSRQDRFAKPLQDLVARGLVDVITGGKNWRGTLTQHGVSAVREWLSTKPPDLVALFPKLYRALDEDPAKDVSRVRRL